MLINCFEQIYCNKIRKEFENKMNDNIEMYAGNASWIFTIGAAWRRIVRHSLTVHWAGASKTSILAVLKMFLIRPEFIWSFLQIALTSTSRSIAPRPIGIRAPVPSIANHESNLMAIYTAILPVNSIHDPTILSWATLRRRIHSYLKAFFMFSAIKRLWRWSPCNTRLELIW